MSDEGLLAFLVWCFVRLLQVLPALLGNVSLLERICKGCYRDVLMFAAATPILLQYRKKI